MIPTNFSDIKGVIFDMDGTMVDNMMVHHKAWQKKLKALGLDLSIEEVKEKVHGINEEILERLFGDKYSKEERRSHSFQKEKEYREIFKDSLRLIDGLDNYLRELKRNNLKLAIGSAAPPENVDFVLDNLEIRDLFDVVLHSGNVKKGKPDPEIYLSIMDKLDLKPENILIFEDSPIGAEAAVRSGAKSVIITTTHKINEFSHLPQISAFITDFNIK